MCELISKTFRPEHRDLQVIYKDSLGIEKQLYIGLASPGVDIEAKIAAHFAEEDQLAENIRLALNPPPVPVVVPTRKKAKK